MQLIVVGTGALGSLIAAYLAKAGIDVTLVDQPGERPDQIATHDLKVTGFRGDLTVSVPVMPFSSLSTLPVPEYALICLHPDRLDETIRSLVNAFGNATTIVQFTSGLSQLTLHSPAEAQACIGAVANFECRLLDDGKVETDFHNFIWLGEFDSSHSSRLQKLQHILSHVAPTFMTQVIEGMIWSKAIYSVEVCLGSLVDAPPKMIFDKAVYRRLAAGLVRENIALATAAGVTPIAFDFFDPNLYQALNPKQGAVTDVWIKNAWLRHEQFRVGLDHPFANQVGLTWLLSPTNPHQEAAHLFRGLAQEASRLHFQMPLTERLAALHAAIRAGEGQLGWENLALLESFRQESAIEVPYPEIG